MKIKDREQEFRIEVSQEEEKKVRKVKEADHAAIVESKVLPMLMRLYSEPDDAIFQPNIFETILDRLPMPQLREIFSRVFTLLEYQDPAYERFKGMFIEYLAKRYMLLLEEGVPGDEPAPFGWLDNYGRSDLKRGRNASDYNEMNEMRVIGHRIGSPMAISDDKKFYLKNGQTLSGIVKSQTADKIVLRNEKDKITKIAKNDILRIDPVFKAADQREVSPAIRKMEDLAQNHPLSRQVYGFYDPTVVGKDGFKVSFTAQEKITYNTSGELNQRNLARGKSIDTYLKPDLIVIFKTIQNLLIAFDDFTYDGVNPADLNKAELYVTIEKGLRILDFLATEKWANEGLAAKDRERFLIYPYQDRYGSKQKTKDEPHVNVMEGCRIFKADGHWSNMRTAKTKLNLHTCTVKPTALGL